MKELSIEEKARAYDEAIERAKDFMNGVVHYALKKGENIMCWIFPELRESEDEKVKKSLIRLVKAFYDVNFPTPEGFTKEQLLSWIEKQGEHKKFCDSIQVGDKVTRNEDGVLVNLSQLKRVAKPSEQNQGEQKPDKTFDSSKLKPDSNPYWTMAPEYQLANEQKPTDKVEPKFKVGDKIQYFNGSGTILTIEKIENGEYLFTNPFGRIPIKEGNNWHLVNLVEQKPAWSEEDDSHIHNIIGFLEECKSYNPTHENTRVADFEISWLKSLRPQSTWKPSEEQMAALKDALNDAIWQYDYKGSLIKEKVTRKHAETIESLYNDLKKLRKE